jgi:uncharacterized protein
MVGRKEQTQSMIDAIRAKKPAFIAVTGRRRVGKTHLIEHVFKDYICFRLTGIQNHGIAAQLKNFTTKLSEHSNSPFITQPANWQDAFIQLRAYLNTLPKDKKQVVFIDELPWVQTLRSGFLQLLAHLWNDYLSKEPHFILVVCGSATSWITKNILNDKGGLHNRVTETITLKPFTLAETKAFFTEKKMVFTNQHLMEIYMAFGGIPYYLDLIKKGESPAVTIERLCFAANGPLKNEYDNLYKALFYNAKDHEAIVATLAKSNAGITREAILKQSKVSNGGPYKRAMEDLLLTGFVEESNIFGKKKRGSLFRLIDEYSVFYHRFIKPNNTYTEGMWQQIAASQPYKIWQGYAFEAVCKKHISEIKAQMGIAAVYATVASYSTKGNDAKTGFQIDILLDRKDNTINLFEIKYYNTAFLIDKAYAKKLQERKEMFRQQTGTRKQLFTTLVSFNGIVQNEYAMEAVDAAIDFSELF